MKFLRYHLLPVLCLLGTGSLPGPAEAMSSQNAPLLPTAQSQITAAGGVALLDSSPFLAIEGVLRFGLSDWCEIGLPGTLALRVLPLGPGSAVFAALGVSDLWFDSKGRILLPWSGALAAQTRFGPESATQFSLDISGVEKLPQSGKHPLWLRGSAALIVDFGPYLTLAAGFSYQRALYDTGPIAGVRRGGFAGDARFSVGAVRSHPHYDLPTISAHLIGPVDIIGIIRIDVDVDTRTTDSRWLFGLSVDLNFSDEEDQITTEPIHQ